MTYTVSAHFQATAVLPPVRPTRLGGKPHEPIPTPLGRQHACCEHALKEIPLRGLLLEGVLATGES